MPAPTAAELTALAEANVETAKHIEGISKNLTGLIAAEGKKIGDAFGLTYAKAADERIKDKDFELQRANDLVVELRRQLDVAGRYADRFIAIRKVVNEATSGNSTSIGITYLLRLVNEPAPPKEN